MPDTYSIVWSLRASKDLDKILDYLEMQWTEREIKKFVQLLEHRLQLISRHPKLYPVSGKKPDIHRSVLSRQTSIYYQVKQMEIVIIALTDNRQKPRDL